MRRIIAALCLVLMWVSAASAEDFLLGVEPEKTEITPAYRSEHRPEHENCYWCTPMDLTDEEAIWKMLTAPMTVVDLDMMKQTVCYREPDENSEEIGMITGSSQGVHVLETLDNGWTMIETYSTSFHDSPQTDHNSYLLSNAMLPHYHNPLHSSAYVDNYPSKCKSHHTIRSYRRLWLLYHP